MQAEIICVGTELLLGDILNTNARYLSRQLADLGIFVYQQSVVGDNPKRLTNLIEAAKQRSDLLILTGGLGPTDDDLTKETVAAAFGDTLILDEAELSVLIEKFQSRGCMPKNNEKQAMVPKNGQKLPNSCGTAPGAVFIEGEKMAVLMPGVPFEMEAMFSQSVRPMLEKRQNGVLRSTLLHVVGIGESLLEDQVKDLLAGENPTAALYAKKGEVAVRVTAFGKDETDAATKRDALVMRFHERLGGAIYSDLEDATLESTVVQLLNNQKKRVAVAESCTGGLICQRLTSVPGASGVFDCGMVTYAPWAKRRFLGVKGAAIKKYSVVSSVVAAQMATGSRKEARADFAIATTGWAGPAGDDAQGKPAGTVYIALAEEKKVTVRRIFIKNATRDRVRHMASQHALDMLRRRLLSLPIDNAKTFLKHEEKDF